MLTLSELEALGLAMIPDFITAEEESVLIPLLGNDSRKKTTSRNKISRFGSHVPYNSNMVSNEIPAHFSFLLDRLEAQQLVPRRPDSLTVNQYQIGQAITPHIDSATSGEVITILSLGHEATMLFQKQSEKGEVVLPPRSLIQMRKDIRNDWNHSLYPVGGLRYSIVFRLATPNLPRQASPNRPAFALLTHQSSSGT